MGVGRTLVNIYEEKLQTSEKLKHFTIIFTKVQLKVDIQKISSSSQ